MRVACCKSEGVHFIPGSTKNDRNGSWLEDFPLQDRARLWTTLLDLTGGSRVLGAECK
jgi:hypothetical protein